MDKKGRSIFYLIIACNIGFCLVLIGADIRFVNSKQRQAEIKYPVGTVLKIDNSDFEGYLVINNQTAIIGEETNLLGDFVVVPPKGYRAISISSSDKICEIPGIPSGRVITIIWQNESGETLPPLEICSSQKIAGDSNVYAKIYFENLIIRNNPP